MNENDTTGNYKSSVRVSIAIQESSALICVGLIFIAVSLADGIAQIILAISGIYFSYIVMNGAAKASKIEREKEGVFDPNEKL